MTLGEVKIEALKLMFANGENELSVNGSGTSAMTIQQAQNDNQFRDYLLKITGAINRCFAELERQKLVPAKRKVLVSLAEENEYNKEIDLSTLEGLSDFEDVQRVTIRNGMEYDANASYQREGNVLILSFVRRGDTVAMIYYPAIARVTSTSDNTAEIGLPDKIASMIPYYCKFDIYREDNPTEADKAYQVFLAGIEGLKQGDAYGYQSSVDRISWGE